MSQMLISEPVPWEPRAYDPGYDPSLDGFFGALEIDALNKLPKQLQVALAQEAQDPEFLAFLVGLLRQPDPYAAILETMTKELVAEEMGLDGYLGYVGMDGLDDLGKSFFKRVGSAFKRVAKKVVDVHKTVAKKVIDIHKKVGHSIAKGAQKVWRKYGNIILTVVGGILAPFTGGASAAAAAVLIAANTMYQKKKAADAAKRAAKKDAAAQQADADAASAQVMQQVDQFFRDNQPWFLEHGITPDKWATLTLDQKIDIINAGANGKLPAGIGPEVDPNTGQPVSQPGQPPPTTTPPPGAIVGPPPGGAPAGAPGSYPVYIPGGGGGGGGAPGAVVQEGGGGGGGEPQYGPPPGAPGAPGAPAEAGPTVGTFDLIVEGQPAGTFPTLEDAARAALSKTSAGDRFEVFANGQSTGLRVRTSDGSMEVPPDIVAKVRAMSHEQMVRFVTDAEKQTGGGFPWWILLVGGGVVAKVAGVF